MKETESARVSRALMECWLGGGAFDEIWIWGIGYCGAPHDYPKNVKIHPAASPTDPTWYSQENLTRLPAVLQRSGATHLWIMQDLWAVNPLAKMLKSQREKTGLRAFLYFPVDAPLEPEWTAILESVDVAVACSEYGREQAALALQKPIAGQPQARSRVKRSKEIMILPHGVDCTVFRPLPAKERVWIRRTMFGGRVTDDFLIVNASANQRRKGVLQTLQSRD